MKRLKMVDLIQEHIDKAQENYGASSNYFNYQISLDLLDKLEKAGMLPPKVQLGNWPGRTKIVNKWDDE